MEKVILIVIVGIIVFGILLFRSKIFKKRVNYTEVDPIWKTILEREVRYYKKLDKGEKDRFEKLVANFLTYTKVTGIGFQVDLTDKLLVASSAIIPVMGLNEFYSYPNISEVLLYSDRFNPQNYDTEGNDRDVLGMVGRGVMNDKMILSQPALYEGFNSRTSRNVGIHEFVHLIDMADGAVDGCPEVLLENQCSIPWMDYIRKKMMEIRSGKSDINPYGATSKVEFFAVASEYFFQKPGLMKVRHPGLYEYLSDFFQQKI